MNADSNSNVFLDNLTLLSYEHRVFVVSLNDNWEIAEDVEIRKSPSIYIENASFHFEKTFGIKLIPLLELNWFPTTTAYPEVYEIGKEIAGELLNLNGEWDAIAGRSTNNNGFDHLLCFSNQTGEHYGFAFIERNIAFHFAQSDELDQYLPGSLSIPDEWGENIIQHEVSHNFGALDRDRAIYPPSIMSKPYSASQALEDLYSNRLWSQVNNWLIQDILLILSNRMMYD